MERISDDPLLQLLEDVESDRVERKESLKGDVAKKARQAICAFANDLANHNQPGVTDYRNPDIADVMKVFGFVQAFGRGIDVARSLMKKNGNSEIEFTPDRNTVLRVLRSNA